MKENGKNIIRTWKYLKKTKLHLLGYLLVSVGEAIISIVLPIASAKIILNMTNGIFEQLIYASLVVLMLNLIVHGLSFFKGFLYRKIYNNVINSLKIDLSRSILELEINELDKNSSGFFIDRINKDSEDIAGVFMEFAYWITYVITNAGVLVTIFIINKYIFVYSLTVAILSFLIDKKRINKNYQVQKKIKVLNESVTSLSTEFIRGIRDIKVLNASAKVLDTMEGRIIEVGNERANLIKSRNLFNLVNSDFRSISNFIFLILGSYLCKNSLLNIPNFVILYNYQGKVKNLFLGIANLSEYMKTFSLASSRIYEIIYDDTFKKEKFGAKHIDELVGNIEIKNVSFEYNEDTPVLKNLSLKINANETLAIVGKSGVGKTTLFGLISSLYKPTEGNIYIDDIDINELDWTSIRDNISIITQNPYIFNFSIKENLLLTSPNATDKEIKEACKIAALDDFIQTLPDKYDTIVGEGGVTLSGGQRQRLAIARALLLKTKIILFDEATSALDNETQDKIRESIKNMKGEYTIVIVAHRLSTIKDADRIVVIDDGKIVEEGTHKKLIKSSKIYKNLYNKENDK